MSTRVRVRVTASRYFSHQRASPKYQHTHQGQAAGLGKLESQEAAIHVAYYGGLWAGRCGIVASASGEHADLLSQVDLFRGFDRVALAKLAGYLEPLQVPAGAALFLQGETGDGLYLISRGSFGVFARGAPEADELLLHVIHRGDTVGEIALLTAEPRTATVRAIEDGEALRLPQPRFLDLMQRDPSVGLAISTTLIRRLRVADAARLGTGSPIDHASPQLAISPGQIAPRNSAARRRWIGRRPIALLLSTIVLVGGWSALPPPAELGAPGWHALVSLIGVVPLLALEALPDGVIALLLVTIWVVGGVAPARAALSGFSSTLWVLVVALFAVGAAIATSGLMYRLALWAVSRASSYRAQVLTLGVSGLIFGMAVPNATGRMSLIAGAVTELAEALGLEPGSKAAAGLAKSALVGYGQMVAPFLTSSSTALLAFALLPEASRAQLSWATWAVRAAPLHLVLLIGMLAVVLWWSPRPATNRPKQSLARVLELQRALLGPLSRREVFSGLTMAALILGLATQSLHGVDPAWIATAALVFMAATASVTSETLRALNWSTVLLLGMLAGMGDVFTSTKLDVWLAQAVVGSLGDLVSIRLAFVVGLAMLCLALSLVLRWQAAVPVIVVAMTPVAFSAGIDPWVVAIVTLTASNTFFLPYQSTIYMTLYSGTGGRLFHHAQMRPLSVAYAVLVLVGLAISVPFWQAIGLL